MLLLIGTIFFRNEECESFELTILRRGEKRKSERFEPLLNAYVIKITPVTIREC